MDIRIPISVLNSAEFSGAEPVDRATFICLLGYCCHMENGGRINYCSAWGDRRWQQTCKVTLEEVRRASDLWHWDGLALVVTFYPTDKEQTHKVLSQKGKAAALTRWEREHGLSEAGNVDKSDGRADPKPRPMPQAMPQASKPDAPGNADGNAIEEGRKGLKGINGSRGGATPGPVTTNFNGGHTPSWGEKNPSLVASLVDSWALPDVKVIDVLRYWRVAFDLKGSPLNSEWVRETRDQPPAMVGLVFINNPENSITLPSHYRAARKAFETTESKTT